MPRIAVRSSVLQGRDVRAGAEVVVVIGGAARLLAAERDEDDGQAGPGAATQPPATVEQDAHPGRVVLGTGRLRDRVEMRADDQVRFARVEARQCRDQVHRCARLDGNAPRDTTRHVEPLAAYDEARLGQLHLDPCRGLPVRRAAGLAGTDVSSQVTHHPPGDGRVQLRGTQICASVRACSIRSTWARRGKAAAAATVAATSGQDRLAPRRDRPCTPPGRRPGLRRSPGSRPALIASFCASAQAVPDVGYPGRGDHLDRLEVDVPGIHHFLVPAKRASTYPGLKRLSLVPIEPDWTTSYLNIS